MLLVLLSATPLPVWAYVIWLVSALAGVVLFNRSTAWRRLQRWVCVVLFASTIGCFTLEVPYHRSPQLSIQEGTTIYVLGDSISVGMGADDRSWAEVLQEMTGFSVVNLALAGATVEGAIDQAGGISESNSLVIIEIGGNDLLGETDAAAFGRSLDRLVASLAREHKILVVELPLFPFGNAFGEAQRRVVGKYDLSMLPKRCFTRVLGMPGSTSDGLHLTQKGHDAMAAIIADVIVMK